LLTRSIFLSFANGTTVAFHLPTFSSVISPQEEIMAKSESVKAPSAVARVLDWKGASINAMALIAPGAFLWITYQAQVGLTVPSGASCANDMWAGILVALGLALLTALSYAELAKIYPEAGFAGCVYFAEKAFIDDQGLKRPGPTSMARIAKLITGWAAHLFYWVYPGVMVAFMGTLASYVYNAVTGNTMTMLWELVIAWVFAFAVGYIAYKGVAGSTKANMWGNIMGQHHPMGHTGHLQRFGHCLSVG
jgi:basic amino acid/polyamine antiporter, APA family